MSTAEVWVRNASMRDYDGEITGLEMGEIFSMRNCRNDDKLLELRYVVEVVKDDKDGITPCNSCGKRFINASQRNIHAQRAQHEAIDLDVGQLKGRGRAVPAGVSGPDRELEPVGAPGPRPVEETGLTLDRGGKRAAGAGGQAREVFRLG